ncbi:MAG: hypothetical protein LBS35_13185 [Synergistaceae bacterium]|jgi:hypothetical protein|nr:hypothetical protein [Synergistaceae bacterium]
MTKLSLSDIDAFKIADDETGETFYGCNQDWYGSDWQRLSGCGPSVVAGILMYLRRDIAVPGAKDKKYAISFMEEVWKYVTPTQRGIHTAEMLRRRVVSYCAAKNLRVASAVCGIPEERVYRPQMKRVWAYMTDALSRDIPIAFLNLHNGEEKNLDEWHWVTVVSAEQAKPNGNVQIVILDRGHSLVVDLSLWLETTHYGGGFVYFSVT